MPIPGKFVLIAPDSLEIDGEHPGLGGMITDSPMDSVEECYAALKENLADGGSDLSSRFFIYELKSEIDVATSFAIRPIRLPGNKE